VAKSFQLGEGDWRGGGEAWRGYENGGISAYSGISAWHVAGLIMALFSGFFSAITIICMAK
jgi:hypothetical protein